MDTIGVVSRRHDGRCAHVLAEVTSSDEHQRMAVAVEEVVAALDDTERHLQVIPEDDPRRPGLESSLADLRILHHWLTNEAIAASANRLTACQSTLDHARRLLRDIPGE